MLPHLVSSFRFNSSYCFFRQSFPSIFVFLMVFVFRPSLWPLWPQLSQSFVHQTFSGCQCPGHTCQYSEPGFAPVSQIGLLAPVFTELLPALFTSIFPPLSLSPGLSWESADLVT